LLVTGLWLFAAGLWLLVTGLWLFAAGTWRLNGYCLIGSIKKPIQPMRQIKLIQRIVFHSAIRNPQSQIPNPQSLSIRCPDMHFLLRGCPSHLRPAHRRFFAQS
jgi:hypothetical protein